MPGYLSLLSGKERRMKPPIFVWEPNDLPVLRSVEAAEEWIERQDGMKERTLMATAERQGNSKGILCTLGGWTGRHTFGA